MVYFENARILDVEDIKEIIDEEIEAGIEAEKNGEKYKTNPTIDRMMWIEANAMSGVKSVYPCMLNGYSYIGEEPKGPVAEDKREIMFYFTILQAVKGHYGLLEVGVKADEIGVSKRFWDKPPKKSVREEYPWPEQPAETGDIPVEDTIQ